MFWKTITLLSSCVMVSMWLFDLLEYEDEARKPCSPWPENFNATCPITIVTSYFRVPSKKSDKTYQKYISNFFRVKACVVAFTDDTTIFDKYLSPGLRVEKVNLKETAHKVFGWKDNFWYDQWTTDVERIIHRGYQLYWIWALKTHFVERAAEINPYMSEYYMWLDAGMFRNSRYHDVDITRLYPPAPFDVKSVYYGQPEPFEADDLIVDEHGKCMTDFRFKDRLAGGLFLLHRSFARPWNQRYLSMMQEYKRRDWFVGKDQNLLATMCIERPVDCMIVSSTWTPGDKWYTILYYVLRELPQPLVDHLTPRKRYRVMNALP